MKKGLIALLVIIQIVWVVVINYPPSAEQMSLGVTNKLGLWLVRLMALGLIFGTNYLATKLINKKYSWILWLIIVASPASTVLWMAYPVKVVLIFLAVLVVWLMAKNTKMWPIAVIIVVLITAGINKNILGENWPITSAISLKNSQAEVMEKITQEDVLIDKIDIPLFLRRIGYNKYLIALKRGMVVELGFWDIESWFFGEVHPLDQKSVVMFFWPEAILFFISLWIMATQKKLGDIRGVFLLGIVAWVVYGLSDSTPFLRESLVMWPIGLIIAMGCGWIFEENKFLLLKIVGWTAIGLASYGLVANQFDLYQRADYWLDNRPIAYKLFFESAIESNYQSFDKVYVSNIVGPAAKYCRFFVGDCSKFIFKDFNLNKGGIEDNSLYIGFVGNFLGPEQGNMFPDDPTNIINNMGLNILGKYWTRDIIAYRYGSLMFTAIKR